MFPRCNNYTPLADAWKPPPRHIKATKLKQFNRILSTSLESSSTTLTEYLSHLSSPNWIRKGSLIELLRGLKNSCRFLMHNIQGNPAVQITLSLLLFLFLPVPVLLHFPCCYIDILRFCSGSIPLHVMTPAIASAGDNSKVGWRHSAGDLCTDLVHRGADSPATILWGGTMKGYIMT